MSNPKLFKYEWILDKVMVTNLLNAKKQPMRKHESVCVFYDKQCTYNPQMIHVGKEKASLTYKKKTKKKHDSSGEITQKFIINGVDSYSVEDFEFEYPKDIIQFHSRMGECNSRCRLHPTQKPVSLFEYLINRFFLDNRLDLLPQGLNRGAFEAVLHGFL